jgi:hypothetical protein
MVSFLPAPAVASPPVESDDLPQPASSVIKATASSEMIFFMAI